jgi:ketosteroid isomerase-like protein
MKRIAFAVCVVVLVFGVAILAKTQTASVEQELMKLENGWADALVKVDLAFLDRILADDYIFTGADGKVSNKAQEIASVKSGESVVTSAANDEMKVRVYGNVAVVTGRWTSKQTLKGTDISGQYRWTDTWVKIAGRWHCVAGHSSLIAQK